MKKSGFTLCALTTSKEIDEPSRRVCRNSTSVLEECANVQFVLCRSVKKFVHLKSSVWLCQCSVVVQPEVAGRVMTID